MDTFHNIPQYRNQYELLMLYFLHLYLSPKTGTLLEGKQNQRHVNI